METAAVETQHRAEEWPVTRLEDIAELQCLIHGDVVTVNGVKRMVLVNDPEKNIILFVYANRTQKDHPIRARDYHYNGFRIGPDNTLVGATHNYYSEEFDTPEMRSKLTERGLM